MARRSLLVACPCCLGHITPFDVEGLLYDAGFSPIEEAIVDALLDAAGNSRGVGIGVLLSSMAAEDDHLLDVGVEAGRRRVCEAVASVSAKLKGSRLGVVRSGKSRSGWRILIAP